MDDRLLNLAISPAGSMEWYVVFSFIAVALIYFLAPVLGYPSDRRGMIATSLYLLVGYGLLSLLQILIQYLLYLASSNSASSGRPVVHLSFLFGILKLILFLASQGTLVLGLQGLSRNASNRTT